MKRITILLALAVGLCGCAKELTPPSFGEISAENCEGTNVRLTGEAQTFNVEISGDDWFVVSPTADMWLIAYEKGGKLYIKVTENNEDRVRESHVDVRGAGQVIRLNITQDYFRDLKFVSKTNSIGAADGTYSVALATNIPDSDITVNISGADWIKGYSVENGSVMLTVDANPSEVQAREAEISVSSTGSGDYSAKTTIRQLPMSGFPYEIPVGTIDFSKYLVYNVVDAVSGDVIARVAREYLYKYDNDKNEAVVDSTYTVVYAVTKKDGKAVVDYSKGLILETRGEVSWSENITVNSAGYDMISHYVKGKSGLMPSKVYIPRGSVYPRFEELSAADKANKVNVRVEPMTLVDTRGDKTDTYAIVKIASQYWLKENLRALRYLDGTPIAQPNNEDTYDKTYPLLKNTSGTSYDDQNQGHWVANCSPTLRPMVIVMANSDRYWNSSYGSFENYRQTLGCCYTYPVLTGTRAGIDVSKKSKITVDQKDAFSPDGWRIPSSSDFQKMVNYLLQSKGYKNSKEKQEALIEKMCSPDARVPGKNICGFSAHASHVTSAGARVNTEIIYPTLEYAWASSSHTVSAFKLISGANPPIANVAIANGYHVRLIKEE